MFVSQAGPPLHDAEHVRAGGGAGAGQHWRDVWRVPGLQRAPAAGGEHILHKPRATGLKLDNTGLQQYSPDQS